MLVNYSKHALTCAFTRNLAMWDPRMPPGTS